MGSQSVGHGPLVGHSTFSRNPPEMTKRGYDEQYIKFGFTSLHDRGEIKGQCVLCQKVLGNQSLRPSKLKLHLEKIHPHHQHKDVDFFKRMEENVKRQRLDQSGTLFQQNKRLTEASYAVSLLIAQQKKPHTVGETLIKPCALKMARILLGEEAEKKFNKISLSNNTVQRRIADLSSDIKEQDVLEQVIKIVNYMKSSALNSRLFKQLCTEMDSEHKNLLYYTKVHWLSKGNVVARVLELREEMQSFLQMQEKHKLEASFHEMLWVFRLAYLVDIFDQLNRLNLKLQGKGTTIIQFIDTLSAFIQKLENWKRKAEEGNFTMFESLSEVTINEPLDPGVAKDVVTHLSCLREEFLQCFPEIGREGLTLMRNPFLVKVSDVQDDLQDELIEFQNDSGCRDVFEASSFSEFWPKMMGSYPKIAMECLWKLLPFATTYLCESGFSTLVQLKTKARNRLECEANLRCALSTTDPRIWKLVQKFQENISH
uniref:zinc finger BED domain-containing protein 5-like n=1 Tax=Myxine glutinosa TaxID=7769 RepID=UPI00358F1C07